MLDKRDRAILKFYLYSGARIATGCKMKVSDLQLDGDEETVRSHLKGGRVKTKGIHFAAAEALAQYIASPGIESAALFRPAWRPAPKLERARDDRADDEPAPHALPRTASRFSELPDGSKGRRCLYSPHSLRVTTATLLLDSGVPIESVQDLLDHKHIATTQIYDKRRRSVRIQPPTRCRSDALPLELPDARSLGE